MLVVNKADILENQEAVEKCARLFQKHRRHSRLGTKSCLLSLPNWVKKRCGQTPPEQKAALRAESGLDALETYITETLDDRARLELKLNSPLGVAENVLRQAQALNREQAKELEADSQLVSDLEGMLEADTKGPAFRNSPAPG